ncbi:hypothetical protein [Paenibacillus arenosi]|uniref:Uncharacterized protein n=1 Tax=Paenibacillus arenosi TaxID=2774142 RepID=A0ABR9B5R0_9BACL|nr:hypothetical protein [Paenibacillus arenosi]MBD8501229.1 hypothetical protein [Paenibacillus arenosi]
MKKFLLIMLCFFIFSSTQVFASSSSLNGNMTDYERYKQLGFSDQEISDMTDEVKSRLEGMNGVLVESKERYYRVTETVMNAFDEKALVSPTSVEITKEQAYKELAEDLANPISVMSGWGSDQTSTSWMKMTTSYSSLGGGRYYIKNSFDWLKKPMWTLTDVVALTYSGSATFEGGSDFAVYNYDVYNSRNQFQETKTASQFGTPHRNRHGLAFEIDLIGDWATPFAQHKNHRGYVSATIGKTNAFDLRAGIFGHYSHAQVELLSTLIINIKGGGDLEVKNSISMDHMPVTAITIEY